MSSQSFQFEWRSMTVFQKLSALSRAAERMEVFDFPRPLCNDTVIHDLICDPLGYQSSQEWNVIRNSTEKIVHDTKSSQVIAQKVDMTLKVLSFFSYLSLRFS
jgi:hypothetical protein